MIPYYSLIILSYNNWAFTKQCLISILESLEEAQIHQGIELVVVDNGSNRETVKQLNAFNKKYKNHPVQLELVLLNENLGYPTGINIGIGHCRGTIIAVLNNDLLFPPNWLAPLVQALEADPKLGFAAPFLSYGGGSVQHVGKTFETIEEMEAFASYFTDLNKAHVIYADKLVGACLVFRRDLLVAIGGNDFWYGIGNFDDVDWCLRARLAGYTIAVVGGSFVHHIGHASFAQVPDQFTSSLQNNHTKFERKWRVREHQTAQQNDQNFIKFEHSKHYIPTQISEFISTDNIWFPKSALTKSLLMCADWSHPESQWPVVLAALLSEPNYDYAVIYCWIPSALYEVADIEAQFIRLIAAAASEPPSSTKAIKIISDEVPYSAVLSLIQSADEIVKVPQDFVNRYIVYLAEQIGVRII
ncbi:glycosyltransferase [Paenibacillus psychroresistens]|uniref:Glycosyltransferase n=1 Tax=Paenibacillus psychroresistens TaxID=1778678 RepID=A0A6B8RIB8_9BACL|nr:glycosyltransferase [Paenibacillus psychroresistens]QGQ95345.1 glycosyltransferase [Paenibacillus psychroresistens]